MSRIIIDCNILVKCKIKFIDSFYRKYEKHGKKIVFLRFLYKTRFDGHLNKYNPRLFF